MSVDAGGISATAELKGIAGWDAGVQQMVAAMDRLEKSIAKVPELKPKVHTGAAEAELEHLQIRFSEVVRRVGEHLEFIPQVRIGQAVSALDVLEGLFGKAKAASAGLEGGAKAATAGLTAMQNVIPELVGAVGIGGLVAAESAAVVKLKELGDEYNRAEKRIRIATGAIGDELADLKHNFESIARGGEFELPAIGQALTVLHQRTTLSGEGAREAAEGYLKLAEVLGTNAGSLVTTTTRAMAALNIKQEESVEFLDKLTVAWQKTGIPVQQYEQILTRSGPVLKQFGLDVNEQIAFIAQLEKSGVPAQQAIFGLRAALQSMTRAGIDPARGFELLRESIKNATSDTEAMTIAAANFPGRAAAPLVQALRHGADAADSMKGAVEGSGGALNRTFEDSKSAATRLGEANEHLRRTFAPLGQAMAKFYNENLKEFAKGLEGTVTALDHAGAALDQVLAKLALYNAARGAPPPPPGQEESKEAAEARAAVGPGSAASLAAEAAKRAALALPPVSTAVAVGRGIQAAPAFLGGLAETEFGPLSQEHRLRAQIDQAGGFGRGTAAEAKLRDIAAKRNEQDRAAERAAEEHQAKLQAVQERVVHGATPEDTVAQTAEAQKKAFEHLSEALGDNTVEFGANKRETTAYALAQQAAGQATKDFSDRLLVAAHQNDTEGVRSLQELQEAYKALGAAIDQTTDRDLKAALTADKQQIDEMFAKAQGLREAARKGLVVPEPTQDEEGNAVTERDDEKAARLIAAQRDMADALALEEEGFRRLRAAKEAYSRPIAEEQVTLGQIKELGGVALPRLTAAEQAYVQQLQAAKDPQAEMAFYAQKLGVSIGEVREHMAGTKESFDNWAAGIKAQGTAPLEIMTDRINTLANTAIPLLSTSEQARLKVLQASKDTQGEAALLADKFGLSVAEVTQHLSDSKGGFDTFNAGLQRAVNETQRGQRANEAYAASVDQVRQSAVNAAVVEQQTGRLTPASRPPDARRDYSEAIRRESESFARTEEDVRIQHERRAEDRAISARERFVARAHAEYDTQQAAQERTQQREAAHQEATDARGRAQRQAEIAYHQGDEEREIAARRRTDDYHKQDADASRSLTKSLTDMAIASRDAARQAFQQVADAVEAAGKRIRDTFQQANEQAAQAANQARLALLQGGQFGTNVAQLGLSASQAVAGPLSKEFSDAAQRQQAQEAALRETTNKQIAAAAAQEGILSGAAKARSQIDKTANDTQDALAKQLQQIAQQQQQQAEAAARQRADLIENAERQWAETIISRRRAEDDERRGQEREQEQIARQEGQAITAANRQEAAAMRQLAEQQNQEERRVQAQREQWEREDEARALAERRQDEDEQRQLRERQRQHREAMDQAAEQLRLAQDQLRLGNDILNAILARPENTLDIHDATFVEPATEWIQMAAHTVQQRLGGGLG